MKEYIVGMINGFIIVLIIGAFSLHDYLVGILLCFLSVSLIYFVFNIIPKIQKIKEMRKEAQEIEEVLNAARDEINEEFRGK